MFLVVRVFGIKGLRSPIKGVDLDLLISFLFVRVIRIITMLYPHHPLLTRLRFLFISQIIELLARFLHDLQPFNLLDHIRTFSDILFLRSAVFVNVRRHR